MPSTKGLFSQKLDELNLAESGKTSEQLHRDLLAQKREVARLSQIEDVYRSKLDKSDPNYQPLPGENNPIQLTDDQLVDNISQLIYSDTLSTETKAKNKLLEDQQRGEQSFWESFTGAMRDDIDPTKGMAGFVHGTEVHKQINLDELDVDNELLNSSIVVATALKNKLDSGDLSALEDLKKNLQNIYNNVDDKSKQKIKTYYDRVEEYYTNQAKYDYAKGNLEDYLANTPLEQRMQELNNFSATPGTDPIFIKGTQSTSKDILNSYADTRQYRTGDFFYNVDNLNQFKAEESADFAKQYRDKDGNVIFNTGAIQQKEAIAADLNYEYNVNVFKNLYDKYQSTLKDYQNAKEAIDKTKSAGVEVNPAAYQALNKFQQEADYLEKAARKLQPNLDYRKYLKTYYPLQYEKKREQDKQEVYKNTQQGFFGNLGESIYRGGERAFSNLAQTYSGALSLFGAKEMAYSSGLKAENLMPPPLYRAVDLNKDGILQDKEYLRDPSNNKISFDQVVYKTADGKSHWNGWAAFEQVLPIATDIGTTILLTRGVGAGARAAGASWANIAKASRLSSTASKTFLTEIAPRISTFGGTLSTTFPRMYAEELKNYKDQGTAFNVGLMRATVEALTETIVPETEFFKGRSSYGALDNAFKKLGKLDPTNLANLTLKRDLLLGLSPKGSLSKFKAGLLVAPSTIRKTLSGAAQEALEEEASLLGNFFVDKYAASQNFSIEQSNELTGENFLETFISGFIPSLVISGTQTTLSNNRHRRDQARWDIANNPTLYTNRINEQVKSGKITKSEGLRRAAAVKNLSDRLNDMEDLRNLKNLSTLLDDKDLQYNFFNKVLFKEELLNIDTANFTDEQKAEYEKALEEADKVILEAKDKSYKYQSLSEQEKKDIIKGVFEKQKNKLVNPDLSVASLLSLSNSVNSIVSKVDSKDPRFEYMASLYEDYRDTVDNTLADRIDGFQQTLEDNPENITLAELLFAKSFLSSAFERVGFSKESQDNLNTLIDAEISSRETLSEEEFYSELEKDLNNPEVKQDQISNLALAELSQEELDNGELTEEAHDHLPDYLKIMLANALELHTLQKQENSEQETEVEKQKKAAYINNYSKTVAGLDAEEALSKIKDMNAKVLGSEKSRTTLVETEDGIKTEEEVKEEESKKEAKKEEKKDKELTEEEKIAEAKKKKKKNTSNFKTEEEKEKEKKQEVKAEVQTYPRPINKEIYEKGRKAFEAYELDVAEELDNLVDEEEKKRYKAKARKDRKDSFAAAVFTVYDSLEDLESAFLGLYHGNQNVQKEIIEFFNSVEAGNPNYDSIRFMSAAPKEVLKGIINRQLEIKPTSQEIRDNEGDTIPETTQETEEERKNSNQLELAGRLNPAETPKPQALSQVHDLLTNYDYKTSNLIDYIQDRVNKGLPIDLHIASQNAPGLFKSILSPNRYSRLESLSQKKSLTETEKAELENLFRINGTLIIPKRTVEFFADKPYELANTNAVLSVITDVEGNVIYFDKNANPTTEDKGFPFIANVRQDPALRSRIKAAGILISPINGLRSAKGKKLSQVYKEGQEIEFNTTQFDEIIQRQNGTRYTKYKGQFYLKDDNGYYIGFDTPKYDGIDIYNLIEDFNEGRLGEEFPKDAKEFLDLLKASMNLKQVTDVLLKHPRYPIFFSKVKGKDRLSIKTEDVNKKAVRISKKQAKELLSGLTLRKDSSRDLLLSRNSFKAIVFENGKAKVKEYKTYKDYFVSDDFGATVPNSIDKVITFGDSDVSLSKINPGNTTATASIQENNPYDEQPKQPIPSEDIYFAELEREYQADLEAFKSGEFGSSIEYAIVDKLGNFKINRESFIRFADKANLEGTEGKKISLQYIRKQEGVSLDQLAQEASSEGLEVTPQDIVDFILKYPAGVGSTKSKSVDSFYGYHNPDLNPRYDSLKPAPKSVTEDTKKTETESKKKPSRRDRLKSFLDNQPANKVDDADIDPTELTRKRELGNKITREQNAQAKAWVESHPIFKDTPFVFNETVAHPEAYAVWSKAGITLFEGANYGEAYHESWHEFSQLYLTPEQKEALYAEARKIWGNLPFVQLEENIAEAFREYALTQGKVLPKEISKYKETKSIFQKIWDFLTNFISNKKTIDKYFGQLYKGNISQYTRKESNAYYKELYSSKLVLKSIEGDYVPQDFKTRAAILVDLDSLFVDIANNVLSKQGASVVNILQNPKLVDKIYKNIEAFINNEYASLREEYNEAIANDEVTEELENLAVYFAEMYINSAALFNFHKANSDLFDNKVKKKLNQEKVEDLESNAETQGLGSFEASINEFSQKELASNLVINAIRTLPRYNQAGEEIFHPYLGTSILGDFEENWNILQRTLSGSSTYEEMFSKIKKLTNTYPQFKKLLSYLKDSKNDISRSSDLSFKNQFFNIFSMPYVDGATVEISRNQDGDIVENKVLRAISLDVVSYRLELDSEFNFNQGPFKILTENGSYALDTKAFFEQFPDELATPEDEVLKESFFNQVYAQLSALGINYSNLGFEELKTKNPTEVNNKLKLIRAKLKSLEQTGEPIYNPLGDISKEHKIPGEEKDIKVKSENTSISFFLKNEIDANPEYANDMRYNAVDKKVWSVNQHTYMTKVLDVLNNATLYPTLDDVYKELPHLNKEFNANAVGSFALRYLFDTNGNRIIEDKKPRTLDLINVFGVKEDNQGEKLIDTNQDLKHYTDIIGLVKGGIEEFNRLSGKNTTRGFALPYSARKDLGLVNDKQVTYSFMDEAGNTQIPSILFVKHILPLIKGEVDVYHNPSSNFKFQEGEIPQLAYFSEILSDSVRSQLVRDLKDLDGKTLEQAVRELPYAAEIYRSFVKYINENVANSQEQLREYQLNREDLIKYHFVSFVTRIEQFKLFFNHPYYYGSDKPNTSLEKKAKDIEKRISAWNAFGSYPVIDEQNLRSLNLMANKPFAQEDAFLDYARQNDIEVNVRDRDAGKINYLVFKDNPVVSETAKNNPNYAEVEDAYTNDKGSATQDAAAVATVDFYRRAFALSTGLTPEMEQEFDRQNKIWSTYLKSLNAEELEKSEIEAELDKLLSEGPYYKFTIKKFQYAGNNTVLTGESVPVFHKYSIKPLLPSEAVQNKRTADILFKLMSSGADYGVFKSGTKVAETIAPVDLFDNKGQVDTSAKSVGTVDMKYFKEQVLVENKETFKVVFSTQLRKLIYKDATQERELEAYQLYKKYMDELVQLDKGLFMEKIGNKEKLVEFIVDELSNKNAAEATKDLIKLKEDGELAYVLDSLVDRTVMESAIVASIKNKIIRQKVNGVQRVQFPVSLLSDRKLKYYDKKDGKITKAETIVSFSKNYYPLLNLEYNGEKIGTLDSKGKPTNMRQALRRLNEALQDADFVKKHERALSIVAIRIPGQGYNTMENFLIVEFLPEESGEIILVPDEMVVKAGSDFDIDKLFTYEPYLSRNGSAERNTLSPAQVIKRNKQIKEELNTYRLLLGEALADRRDVVDQVEKLFENKEFSRASDVYEELQKLKNFTISDQEELIDTNQIDPLEALKRKFEQGESYEEIVDKKLSKEDKKARQERKAKIKELSALLNSYSKLGLGVKLTELNNSIGSLFETIARLEDEQKGLRNKFSNNILFNISDRLTQTEIFEDLITPNSTSIINEASEGVQAPETEIANYTNIVNPIYQLYVFSLNSYKKSLGTDAKNNVLHSILQKADVQLVNKAFKEQYLLAANMKGEDITFTGTKDTNGRPISLVQGQMISAHVDIEKDDAIARLGLNNVITPVVNYMLMAGTPFEDIVKVINTSYSGYNPILEYSKSQDIEQIVEDLRSISTNPVVGLILDDLYVKDKLNKKKILQKLSTIGRNNRQENLDILNQESDLGNVYRFLFIVGMKEHSDKMFTLSSTTDFDTMSPQNFESFRKGEAELKELIKEGIYNEDGIKRVIKESITSEFQVQQDIFDKLSSLFPVSANPVVTNFIVDSHKGIKTKFKPDYDKFSRVFKNDFLYYMYAQNTSFVTDYSNFLRKTSTQNIKTLYDSIKLRLEKKGIKSENKIFDLARFNSSDKTTYIRTGLRQTSYDYSVDFYREEFEKGINYSHPELNPATNEEDALLVDDIQDWFEAFAVAGIIGTNLNKRFDSYLPLIPESFYTNSMNTVLREFSNMDETAQKSTLADFYSKFRSNHPELFGTKKSPLHESLLFYRDYINEPIPLTEEKEETLTKPAVESEVKTPTSEQLDLFSESNQAAQDSLDSIRKKNNNTKDNC